MVLKRIRKSASLVAVKARVPNPPAGLPLHRPSCLALPHTHPCSPTNPPARILEVHAYSASTYGSIQPEAASTPHTHDLPYTVPPADSAHNDGDNDAHNNGHNDAHNDGHNHEHNDGHNHEHKDADGVGCRSCGLGHDHHEVDKSWGPIRGAVYTLLERTHVLNACDWLSHSLRSSLLSATCLSVCIGLTLAHGSVLSLPSLSAGATLPPHAAVAGGCMAVTLLLSGLPACVDALMQIMRFNIDAHVLMALAGCGSFALGAPVEGALLFVLFHIAHTLEAKFVRAAHSSITALIDTMPVTARLTALTEAGAVDWSQQAAADVQTIEPGSFVIVKPGDTVPLDGVVQEGQALVGQQNMTGESVPSLKRHGSSVFSGGHVHDGTLAIRTTARAQDSTAARIAAATSSALQRKAPVDTMLARITTRWSQAVVALTSAVFAALLALGVPMLGPQGALYRCLGLLTTAAPCALLLVPLAFVCALAVLSRHGIMVKGAYVLDALLSVSCVALDKTGTLSEGQLNLTGVRTVGGSGGGRGLLRALPTAAALSLRSHHPVSAAVLREWAAQSDGAAAPTVDAFHYELGAGVIGSSGREAAVFGSLAYVSPWLSPEQLSAAKAAVAGARRGTVCSFLAQGPVATGDAGSGEGSSHELLSSRALKRAARLTLFSFSDLPKSGSVEFVKRWRSSGASVRVLTGDDKGSAVAMASRVAIPPSEVLAGLGPERKAEIIQGLQRDGDCVLMVGDAINDAPALAQADVSVALASSMDSATAGVANVVLVDGGDAGPGMRASLGQLDFLMQAARAVRAVVTQNLALASFSIVCASVPAVAGVIPLWVAVLMHEGSSLLVALNSCRLLLLKPRTL